MSKRPRVKHEKPLAEKLADHVAQLRQAADKLPQGKAREELLRRAEQAETASRVNGWVTSAGLQPPK